MLRFGVEILKDIDKSIKLLIPNKTKSLRGNSLTNCLPKRVTRSKRQFFKIRATTWGKRMHWALCTMLLQSSRKKCLIEGLMLLMTLFVASASEEILSDFIGKSFQKINTPNFCVQFVKVT